MTIITLYLSAGIVLEGGGEEPLMISEVVEGGAAYEDGVLTVSDHCIPLLTLLLLPSLDSYCWRSMESVSKILCCPRLN